MYNQINKKVVNEPRLLRRLIERRVPFKTCNGGRGSGHHRGSEPHLGKLHRNMLRLHKCMLRCSVFVRWHGNKMSLEIWDLVLPGFLEKFGRFFCDDRVMIVLMIK